MNTEPLEPECNGMCLTGYDIGLSGSGVAYAHPLCPEHGDDIDHDFALDFADGAGRLMCKCGAYQIEHPNQVTESLKYLEFRREIAYGYVDNAVKINELKVPYGH